METDDFLFYDRFVETLWNNMKTRTYNHVASQINMDREDRDLPWVCVRF